MFNGAQANSVLDATSDANDGAAKPNFYLANARLGLAD